MKVQGFGALEEGGKLQLVEFERSDSAEHEVEVDITHCGVCHSDIHNICNDWGGTAYPTVPGHEIVGVVTKVGSKVEKFKEGDRIGIGCMIDSCGECEMCEKDLENYCQGPQGCTMTYGGTIGESDLRTYGGYSSKIVVRESFGITIPDELDSKFVGPIMCAGITVYSPMKHWGLEKGKTLGVVGVGGLGHMAIKLGKALGAKVVAFTRDDSKKDAILKMGADQVVISKNDEEMEQATSSLDLVIDTIPVAHDVQTYFPLMKTDSTIVIVGNLEQIPETPTAPMVFKRISVAGSLIGGIRETQEVIDLCAKHDITPEVKKIGVEDLNSVIEEMKEGTSESYRHVIDMSSLESASGTPQTIENPTRSN